jgi:hypothetical protein
MPHFKHYKNINFEISYFIEILSKWHDSNLLFKKNIITFISFWKCKTIGTIIFLISLFNNILMTIFLKKNVS